MRSHKAVMIMMMGVEPPSAPVQRKLTQGSLSDQMPCFAGLLEFEPELLRRPWSGFNSEAARVSVPAPST